MSEYNTLSEDELQAVIAQAEKALKDKQLEKRKQVLAQIKELAASIGVTVKINDQDQPASVRKGKKIAPKYRNPGDAAQTWTGRGVAPKWMQALINEGRDKSEFLL
ncbi:MAG: H-NS histone family protein [Methylococcales bacterium]|jgi:DNA-binding protein H-NS|nr:H-NS histone family protein [Methylococcaceae bacterium]